MLEDRSGILYNGDFFGRYMSYIGEFNNKKQLVKQIKKFIEPTGVEFNNLQYIRTKELPNKPDGCLVDVTINYGNRKIFLLVIYD